MGNKEIEDAPVDGKDPDEKPDEKPPRRKRVLPKQPIPAADPIGTAIAVVGIILLIIACFSDIPVQTGMPGVCGLIAGAVIGLGFAVLYRRFTLRFFLILALICGTCATLAELSARFGWYAGANRTYIDIFRNRN